MAWESYADLMKVWISSLESLADGEDNEKLVEKKVCWELAKKLKPWKLSLKTNKQIIYKAL